MACPNCESEHVYTQIDDEWDGFYERSGRVESIRWGCEICPDCGWTSEPFGADVLCHKDEMDYGLWDS